MIKHVDLKRLCWGNEGEVGRGRGEVGNAVYKQTRETAELDSGG
jgi:hypothetical protein